jgi:hypothetical protein
MQNTYLHGEIEILYVDGTALIDICEKETSSEPSLLLSRINMCPRLDLAFNLSLLNLFVDNKLPEAFDAGVLNCQQRFMRIIMRFPYVGDNSSGHVYVYILRP